MHSKGNYKQDEKTTLRMGENNYKEKNWEKINLQNHLIQLNKNNSYNYKQPNNKKWADTSPEKKNRWPINILSVYAQHHSLLEKCNSKLKWGITSHQSEWSSPKNLQIINSEEDMEKRAPSCTVGGNVNWYSHFGEQYGDSSKARNKIAIWPSNPTTGYMPWENYNSKRHMQPSVHCRTIYNSQDMEAT